MRKRITNYSRWMLALLTLTSYQSFGQGFSPSPVSWSTPTNLDQISDFSTGFKHTTMDIDGDSKPDLVVTYNNGYIGSVGNFRWDVYLNLSTVSVEELNNSSLTLKTFPNPTNDVFYIDLSEVPLHSVTIYNNFGQILHQERGLKSNNFSFDLSSYSSGLYYLKLESDENVNTIKIIRK
jgi:hypothetical protein